MTRDDSIMGAVRVERPGRSDGRLAAPHMRNATLLVAQLRAGGVGAAVEVERTIFFRDEATGREHELLQDVALLGARRDWPIAAGLGNGRYREEDARDSVHRITSNEIANPK